MDKNRAQRRTRRAITMGVMATWKDGAAYAPVERPDGFATPVADPLPSGAPYTSETPGPMHQPSGFEPMPPQQPLAEVGTQQHTARDPRDAFTVASSLVTAGPDAPHVGPRDPRTPFPMPAQSALDTAPPPPTGPPLELPPPPGHLPAPPVPGQAPAQAPPPGLARAQDQGPVPESHRSLARVASVLCFVGFFATGTAPYMLLAAGLIGLRTKRLTQAVGHMALGSGAAGVLMMLLLERWQFAPFAIIWGFIALGCSIGFLIYSNRR